MYRDGLRVAQPYQFLFLLLTLLRILNDWVYFTVVSSNRTLPIALGFIANSLAFESLFLCLRSTASQPESPLAAQRRKKLQGCGYRVASANQNLKDYIQPVDALLYICATTASHVFGTRQMQSGNT